MDFKELVGNLRLVGLRKDKEYELLIEELKQSKIFSRRVYITFLCCPDYSYTVDSSGWAVYDYKQVNTGVGMLGLIFIKAFLEIVSKAIEYQAHIKITFVYGDNEVDDVERMNSLHLSANDFLNKVQCSTSSAKIFYTDLLNKWFEENGIPNNGSIVIDSMGMKKRYYTDEILKIARNKIKTLSSDEVSNLMLMRKNVIEATYKKLYEKNKKFFYSKTQDQVLDRVILGTALSREREHGKKSILISQSIISMMGYFNYKNKEHVPSLSLGSSNS